MKKYSSYKPSGEDYIGDIPNNWECIRLGMLGVFSSSGIDKKTNDNETSVRMVNYTDIIQSRKYNPIQTGEKEYMVVSTPVSKLNEHRLIKGDMVFIPSSETKEDLGYSSLIDFDENDIVYSYHILRYRTHKNIHHYFKKYLINHHSVLNQFSRESKGTTRQIIGRNVFNNVRVVLPPLQEQEQIVNYLDEKTTIIDKLISTKQRKVELLKEQRTTLINQVITKGLNPNVKMKDSGVEWIGEIPESWDIKKMKYCLKMISEKKEVSKEDIKISPENVENGTGVCFNFYSDYTGEGMKFIVGDILLNKLRIYLKKILITENDGFSMGEMIVLRTFDGINKYYYYTLFNQGLIDLLNNQSTGVKLPRVSPDTILNSEIVYPPIEEQKKIVEYIDIHTKEIDDLVSMEQKKIELLKEYRQSLISEVITGKIKVVDNVSFNSPLSINLPYKLLNPKYSKTTTIIPRNGEKVTIISGEKYFEPKVELIDFLNSQLSKLVKTENQKVSIENFFLEKYYILSHTLPYKNSEYGSWTIFTRKDGSVLSVYNTTSGIMEDMRFVSKRFLIKLNGEVQEFEGQIYNDEFMECFKIYK